MKILKKLKFNKKSHSNKQHKIEDCKNTLENLSLEFSNLIDKLYTLKSDINWLQDMCLDYNVKIQLAIKKGNINLAKKALEKKLILEIEVKSMEDKVNYLSETETIIDELLNQLEAEYDNISTNRKDKSSFKVSSYIKTFAKTEQKIKDKFLEVEETLVQNSPPPSSFDINIDEEIKKYI